MISTPNGTTQSPTAEPYTPEEIDRLTALGVVLTWDDLDAEDRLEYCLANPVLDEWLDEKALDTFADFRMMRKQWVKIKAGYRRLGGDVRILEEAVDGTRAERRLASASAPALITTCAADVAPEAVEWEWDPYIALGTICILDGDPGIGKSLLMLQLAANISKGLPFPDQTGKPTIGTASLTMSSL